MISGGGSAEGTGIIEKFIELAGGKDAKIVIVPTAGGNRNQDGSIKVYKEENVLASWKKRGLTNVHMLHTPIPRSPTPRSSPKPLRDANAVWFDGRPAVEHRRFLREHADLQGVPQGARARRRHRRQFGRRDHSGRLSRARRHRGPDIVMTPEPEHRKGFAFLRKSRDRSAHQHAQSLGRHRSRHQEVSRICSASACRKARRSSSRATASR